VFRYSRGIFPTSPGSQIRCRKPENDPLDRKFPPLTYQLPCLQCDRGSMTPSESKASPATRILFVSSNGVGLGHLSRLIAVARRLPESFEAIFLTMSQALPVVQQFGFHVEYVPFHLQTQSAPERWNTWLAETLDQVLEAYSIRAVVFDGNVVYPGLLDAISQRPDCRLIWIRRGMWRTDQDNAQSLLSGKSVDLIIEPDDVASDFDLGASAERREETALVDPICLLDHDEILSRDGSCRTLTLDPDDRYVLIQFGAGNNYNFIDLIDGTIEALEKTRIARPVIAEWLTSDFPLDLWPQVPRLRCYPISRYYRAFDFTISAAGYNTFNEIIGFGVPSVLVPNLNRSMDDQRARAAFADRHGAAVHLDHEMLPILDQVLRTMMDENRLSVMKEKCRLVAKPNGAGDAAKLVVDAAAHVGSQ
jgi:hypothetical protein